MDALVTGGAGFIGSHLTDALVELGGRVRVLDDLSAGLEANLNPRAEFVHGSITDPATVAAAVEGCEVVFHLAAHGAVARSLANPLGSNEANVTGTLTVLTAARDAGVRRLVFASSSSIYGGADVVPTPESQPLRPRSPYAVSKMSGEWYVRVFAELFPIETVALRYFNVFGPRQRPDSTYAAVIPLFTSALLRGDVPTVHGTGEQSRDFTYVADVVAANIAAAQAPADRCSGNPYNVAAAQAPADRCSGNPYNVAPGSTTSLLELLAILGELIGVDPAPQFVAARAGDIVRSQADASAATRDLGWTPRHSMRDGLASTVEWMRSRI